MLRLVAWGLLALTISGCGAGAKGSLAGGGADRVHFGGASAEVYLSQVDGDGARGLFAGTLRDAAHLAAQRRGTDLRGDPRLARLAELLAPHLREGGKLPPDEEVRFLARHLGITFPDIHSLLVGTPEVAEIGVSVSRGIDAYLARIPYDVYGAYTFERSGLTIAIVLFARSRVELAPIPRSVGRSGAVKVRGDLDASLRDPELVVRHPSGRSERIDAGRGTRIEVDVSPEGRGVAELQLVARGPEGAVPVANFPVAVGVDHARALDGASGAEGEAGERASAEGVAEGLFRRLNETRRSAGLAPLELDAQLTELARAHSVDMREASFIGHTSPTEGDPSERAERAGIRSGLILENVGRGASAGEVHAGLSKSPAHRRNLLNPDVTHVGIAAEPDGRGHYLVTQIFVRRVVDLDLEEARARLLGAINRRREGRGAEPLASDPNLQRAATEGARAYFSDPSLDERGAIGVASAAAGRHAVVFSRVGSVMTVVDELGQAFELESAIDPAVRNVGIGLAQGERPGAPPNSIAVVLLLGWPR